MLFSPLALASSSLLYKISSPQGGEMYILGSIHVGTPDMYPLKPAIYEAFDEAQRLVVELKGDSIENSPSMLKTVLNKGFYPEKETLYMHLDERQRELIAPFMEYLPLGAKSNMKPWLAAVTIDMVMLTKLGYSSKFGIEKHFEELSSQRGLPVFSIETAGEQLSLFINLTEEESKLLLESSLIELSEVEDFMGEVVSAWKEGDEEEFAAAFFEAYLRWPKLTPLLDKVIYDRNKLMFTRLLPYLELQGRTFVVLGAGHVVSERGVPGLFRAQGFTVEKF
ncbi:MAG: TraB/GumN family protein [Deltaproteobacteria bacterium]|nr:TraB/GumN family protein [Deltaproteobacteria bacterium]